jgi:hypothetical protein
MVDSIISLNPWHSFTFGWLFESYPSTKISDGGSRL